MAEIHKSRAKHALAVGKLHLSEGGGTACPFPYVEVGCRYTSANDLQTLIAVKMTHDEAARVHDFIGKQLGLGGQPAKSAFVQAPIDPRTGRPAGDHGTALQAIQYAVEWERLEADTFLKCWLEGDLDEWPEFYEWLKKEDAK